MGFAEELIMGMHKVLRQMDEDLLDLRLTVYKKDELIKELEEQLAIFKA